MKIKNNIAKFALVFSLIIVSLVPYSVYASNTEEVIKTNIRELNQYELYEFMGEVSNSIVDKNTSGLKKYTDLFDNTEIYKVVDFVTNNNIKGNIVEIIIDYVNYEYSSTQDDVIMCNIRVRPYNENVTVLYMIEFHVNKDGVIYGHNVWAY